MNYLIATDTVTIGSGDIAPTSGVPGEATVGNPAASPPIPATDFPAYGWNMVCRELMNLLTAAGLTPSSTDWTQVLQSVRKLTGVNYIKSGTAEVLPSELIIQTFASPSVQLGAANTEVEYSFTFPVAFPNGLISIFARDTAGACINWNSFTGTSLTGGSGYVWSPIAGTSGVTAGAVITAIGW